MSEASDHKQELQEIKELLIKNNKWAFFETASIIIGIFVIFIMQWKVITAIVGATAVLAIAK